MTAPKRLAQSIACTAVVLSSLLTSPNAIAQAPHRAAPGTKPLSAPPSRALYAGDAACTACHAREAEPYAKTAHHLTSRLASPQSVAGSFAEGANLLKTANPALSFRMSADGTGFHQTAIDVVSPGQHVDLTEPIDLVVGSGRKAQTYLYWKADQLFELPVSYWVNSGAWINSPGYTDGAIRFDRPVYPRCLECHAGSFKSLAPPANRFEKTTLVLGIECERCHGPGAAHVAFYGAHPASAAPPSTSPQAMLRLASLPRSRQIDGCALCHAGLGEPLAPALSYQPGEPLNRYLRIPPSDPTATVDVHGNQVELLERSRCFRNSSMTCTTCHNVHQPQRDPAAFAPICLQCHKAQQCGRFRTEGDAILTRCISCHMPLRKSSMLFSDTGNQTLQLPVRDHHIAIYPDSAANYPKP